MTKHYKHLLGRYNIKQTKNAVEHAKRQYATLLATKGIVLADNWVEIQVFLYDTEKE